MNFYTLRGAVEFVKKRGKPAKFWCPLHGGRPPHGSGAHIWVYEPKGRLQDCCNSKHSIAVWVTPKGFIEQRNGMADIQKLLRLERPSKYFEIRYKDLTPEAQDDYLRFKEALIEEELNLAIEPIAVLERE